MTGAADKVVSRDEMARARREAAARTETVVLTNGCFDVIHRGHVEYLEAARGLGGKLFVGVNSDASVTRLKGAGRPVNGEDDRAMVLAALEAVSLVTVFGEDTATELVRTVRPDIYVKGGDYSEDPQSPTYPIEGRAVAEYGGRVRILPYTAGYSTTEILRRIGG